MQGKRNRKQLKKRRAKFETAILTNTVCRINQLSFNRFKDRLRFLRFKAYTIVLGRFEIIRKGYLYDTVSLAGAPGMVFQRRMIALNLFPMFKSSTRILGDNTCT